MSNEQIEALKIAKICLLSKSLNWQDRQDDNERKVAAALLEARAEGVDEAGCDGYAQVANMAMAARYRAEAAALRERSEMTPQRLREIAAYMQYDFQKPMADELRAFADQLEHNGAPDLLAVVAAAKEVVGEYNSNGSYLEARLMALRSALANLKLEEGS